MVLTHRSFSKTYRLDLVVQHMVYELKTVHKLAPEHEAQAIHYAVMLGVNLVKLVNFRSPTVTGKLICSPLLLSRQKEFTVLKKRWQPISDTCTRLFDDLLGFLSDAGPCLEVQIYNDLLTHFSGAEDHCLHRLPVVRNGQVLGSHRMPCHAEQVAYAVTALPDAPAHECHLRRLLPLLPLRGIQWFNLYHGQLEAITLQAAKATGSISLQP